MKRALFIDNYDSFSDIIVYYLNEHFVVDIIKNNTDKSIDIITEYDSLILSPGPGDINDIGRIPEFFKKAYGNIPVLGICLGFQYICTLYGGRLKVHKKPQHGVLKRISVCNSQLIGKDISFDTVFYNSLYIDPYKIDSAFIKGKQDDNDYPVVFEDIRNMVYGAQFHPEALKSEYRDLFFKNFLNISSKKRGL